MEIVNRNDLLFEFFLSVCRHPPWISLSVEVGEVFHCAQIIPT